MMAIARQRNAKLCGVLGLVFVAILVAGASSPKSDERIRLLPRLQNGQTLHYESHARLNRSVKTKSNVSVVMEPPPLQADFAANLKLSVQDFHELDHRPMLAAETQLLPEAAPAKGIPAPVPLKVAFSIGGDGGVTRADGLDDLDPPQRLVWQFWVAQFAFGWTLPSVGVKPGEKWKSIEPEQTPSPIANLVWERETTYVQDDRCPILQDEQCAVFLINATLNQKSKPENATPEDYRLHQLKTSGTVKGNNQTVLYISRKTGLLLRASEDLLQTMDVTIAKSDGSNQVQYQVEVTSHFETVFVPAGSSNSQ
jgi:hypothetical protein